MSGKAVKGSSGSQGLAALAVLIALALQGCASKSSIETEAPLDSLAEEEASAVWARRLDALTAVNDWSLGGRAAVRTASEGGRVHLDWQQRDDDYSAEFRSPFGTLLLSVASRGGRVRVRSLEKQETTGEDPAELIDQHFGWRLPVRQLPAWLLGIPGEAEDFEIDGRGRLNRLAHNGWQLDYVSYTRSVPTMPKEILIQGPDTRVRLLLSDWRLPRALTERRDLY